MSEKTETTTLYARVPTGVKEQVDTFAETYGLTMAGAVAVLLNVALKHAKEICPTCQRELET